jgi:hypothetical protein
MLAGHRDHQFLLEQLHAVEVGARLVRGQERETQVQVAPAQHGQGVGGGVLVEANPDGRVAGVEGRDQQRHVHSRHRRRRRHRHAAGAQAAQRIQLVGHARRLGEHAASTGQQDLAGMGQRYPAARAPQQIDAELDLEPAHLLGDRRLGDHQLLARAREAPVPGYRLERPQLALLHMTMLWAAVEIGL